MGHLWFCHNAGETILQFSFANYENHAWLSNLMAVSEPRAVATGTTTHLRKRYDSMIRSLPLAVLTQARESWYYGQRKDDESLRRISMARHAL